MAEDGGGPLPGSERCYVNQIQLSQAAASVEAESRKSFHFQPLFRKPHPPPDRRLRADPELQRRLTGSEFQTSRMMN